MKIGQFNHLQIIRESDHGLFLQDSKEQDILLPHRYVTDTMQIGEFVDVFVYFDSEDRLIATTLQPLACIDEIAFFKVVDTTKFGAFVDWGIAKDLFVPFAHQKKRLKIGDRVLLKVIIDPNSGRLMGSAKFEETLKKAPPTLMKNNQLRGLIIQHTPLGYKVIANHLYEGMLFHNEIFEPIKVGDVKTLFVKQVRKDGKLDLILQAIGHKNDDTKIIIDALKSAKGFIPLHSKASPEDIQKIFHLSKKSFKKALQTLLQNKKISLDDKGITLL